MIPLGFLAAAAGGESGGPGGLWTPGQLSPFAWWNDDGAITDSGGLAADWENIGTSGYDVVGVDAFVRPTINASGLNSRRTLTFQPGTTSTADYMNNNDSGTLRSVFQNQAAGWAFAVVKRNNLDGVATPRNIFVAPNGTDGNSRFVAALSQAAINKPALFARRLDGDSTSILEGATSIGTSWAMVLWIMDWANGDAFIYLNGELDASNTSFTSTGNTSNTQSQRSVAIGGYPGNAGGAPGVVNPADADLAELIVSRGVPSTDDIDRLFGYAAHRWGLNSVLSALHPYKTEPPTI